MTDFQKQFAEALIRKKASRLGIDRADLAIVGYRSLDNYGVVASFAYNPSIGRVTDRDLNQYISAYIGNYHPIMETMKVNDQAGTLSVVVAQYKESRRFKDSERMIPVVAGISYMDKNLGDMWNVQDGLNGSKHLVRVSGENLNEILAERINRLRASNVNTVQHKACAALLTPNLPNIMIGDVVKFFANGDLGTGEVVAFQEGNTIIIKPEGTDQTLAIETNNILDIISRASSSSRNKNEELINYYANAFGNEEYARQLVEGPNAGNPYTATASTKKKS
jgi:hypothetical protein